MANVTLNVNGRPSTVDVTGGHAAALGAARCPEPEGNEVRVRHRPVRRLHGPSEWQGRSVVPDDGLGGERRQGDHHRGSRPMARIRCRKRGSKSTCRSAATARPAS